MFPQVPKRVTDCRLRYLETRRSPGNAAFEQESFEYAQQVQIEVRRHDPSCADRALQIPGCVAAGGTQIAPQAVRYTVHARSQVVEVQ